VTAEVIEGEVRQLPALRPAAGIAATGALALAALTDDEFELRLSALEKGAARIARIQKALMTADVDYGIIPGTKKPTLLKPGAEKLCLAYSLAGDFTPERTVGDGETAPALSYLTRCDLHLGDLDGPVVAVGYGAANSWEVRYRYRQAERVCPSCGMSTIIKGKAEYGGGWVCFKKKGGCGAKYADRDEAITGQEIGQVDNPDPWDLDVTLAKMAEKRAHVDATLRATGASALFTQDMEDRAPDPEPSRVDTETGEIVPPGSLIGVAEAGKAPADFELRETPDGYAIAFKLKDGRKGFRVDATGPLAFAIAANREAIEGQRVVCYGTIGTDGFTANGGHRVTYATLALEKLTAGALNLDDAANADAARGGVATEPTAEPSAPATSSATEGASGDEAEPGLGTDAATTEAGAVTPGAAPDLCGSDSPYGDGLTCELLRSHKGPHKVLSQPFPTTWTD
jgi:hypothetical protein